MTWKVLISAPYAMPVIDRYRESLRGAGCEIIVPKVNERLEEHELLPIVGDIDGIICGDDRITARVIEADLRVRMNITAPGRYLLVHGSDAVDDRHDESLPVARFCGSQPSPMRAKRKRNPDKRACRLPRA